jgi:hypothetical protein
MDLDKEQMEKLYELLKSPNFRAKLEKDNKPKDGKNKKKKERKKKDKRKTEKETKRKTKRKTRK